MKLEDERLAEIYVLEKEIKQLKEEYSKLLKMSLESNANLRQKLEKIRIECDKEPRAYILASFLKEILDS